jgi:hypothetical protein
MPITTCFALDIVVLLSPVRSPLSIRGGYAEKVAYIGIDVAIRQGASRRPSPLAPARALAIMSARASAPPPRGLVPKLA